MLLKREATIILKVELSADTISGIEAAALEALSHINCDIAAHSKEFGALGAKLIDKGFEHHDEDRLFNIVLETSGLSEKDFIHSNKWDASIARNLFAYYAKKYLEWPYAQIAKAVSRDRSTVSSGIRELIGLVTGVETTIAKKRKNTYENARKRRAQRVVVDMERIQRKWSEAKR